MRMEGREKGRKRGLRKGRGDELAYANVKL